MRIEKEIRKDEKLRVLARIRKIKSSLDRHIGKQNRIIEELQKEVVLYKHALDRANCERDSLRDSLNNLTAEYGRLKRKMKREEGRG